MEKLEAPFDSYCIDQKNLGFYSRAHCYDSCLIEKSLIKFDKISFAVLFKASLDKKFIYYADIGNDTFVDLLSGLEDACENKHTCARNLIASFMNTYC